MKDATPGGTGDPRHLVILTGSQQRALLAFLKRAQITGAEARGFIEVFGLVQNARVVAVQGVAMKPAGPISPGSPDFETQQLTTKLSNP